MANKERLDVLLVQRQLFESREQAQRIIMRGNVFVNGQRIDKAGTKVPVEAEITVTGTPLPYVSRGGIKLAGAFDAFGFSMQEAVVCDIGASTGGFVDCALQHGATRVYAVDVGYGQLSWKLRTNTNVINMERTNARYLTPEDFPEAMDWVTTDVSFISLEKILPVAYAILKETGQMLALIKPQFEAGKAHVGKKGVVRDPAVHVHVLESVTNFAETLGFHTCGLAASPIQGPQGNIEYLYWMQKALTDDCAPTDIEALVKTTFAAVKG